MPTAVAKLTYEEYLATPEIKRRYDIVDGEFQFMAPAPDLFHQDTVFDLGKSVDRFVRRRKLGHVVLAPYDILVSRKPLRTRQPDVLYVARERRHILRDQCEGAPDVVIEILSPGNTPKKVQEKLEDYAKLGVPEVWYAAPKSRTLEVLILERGKYRSNGISSPGHAVNSLALEGFVLPRSAFEHQY